MTPSSQTCTAKSMQLNTVEAFQSNLRLIGEKLETERLSPKLPQRSASTSPQTLQPVASKHQRIHTLILGARQVEDQGSVSGQALPYIPKGPSLFREDLDIDTQIEHRRSPLQKLAYTNYSFHTNRPGFNIPHPATWTSQRRSMPHAVSVAQTGFQALILCGPGIGLSTFTNVPHDYPKALVPIANRPMIWYVLDWCYRTGVTDITIITPPASKKALSSALAQHPDLTSLPSPKPDLLAPAELEFNTPTAELLRLTEVQKIIKSDFLLLPCDLVCNIQGDVFLESYLTSMAGIAGSGADFEQLSSLKSRNAFALGAEGSGRRGGLSIWYNTANREESIKKEECDFMGTVEIDTQYKPPIQKISDMPEGAMRKLVWTTPMSELLEDAEENKSLRVRQSLLRRYGAVKCLTQYRDSHIYFFPHWVKDFAAQNEDFESISEDLVGTWAKSDWRKPSYREQIGAKKTFKQQTPETVENGVGRRFEEGIEDEIDLLSLSSTQVTQHAPNVTRPKSSQSLKLASRVRGGGLEDSMISSTTDDSQDDQKNGEDEDSNSIPFLPPMLSYILSSSPSAPLIRRVDSTPLLLNISLLLAKLPAQSEADSTPFSHPAKIHPTSQPAQGVRVSVSTQDSLVASNTILSQHCTIKQTCVGSGCKIGSGARINGCIIMDGAQIGDKAVLNGCVIGKKAVVGKGVQLSNCEVQDTMVVPDGHEAKNDKFLVGGFEEGEDGFVEDDE